MATAKSRRPRFRGIRELYFKAVEVESIANGAERVQDVRVHSESMSHAHKQDIVPQSPQKRSGTWSSGSETHVGNTNGVSSDVATSISIPEEQMSVLTPVVGPELDLQITRIDVVSPKPGEVVVKIAWTGLCGSDPSFCVGPQPGFAAHNHIAGHEGIGHIIASHDASLLHRPVAARYLSYSCQACKYCLRGLPESCRKQLAFPKHLNGTFQQYITVPLHSIIWLPGYVFDRGSGISPCIYAAALCSGSAALKALRAADPRPHDVIVVFGIAGAIGHLVGLMAKNIYAAKVIGVDVKAKAGHPMFEDRDVCDRFIAAPEGPEQEEAFQLGIAKFCEELRGQEEFPCAADSVIVSANRISGFKDLTNYVCDGGSIIIVGGPSDGHTVSFPLQDVLTRQIRIEGSLMGGNREMLQCLDYIRTGVVKPYVTEITFEEIPRYLTNFKTLRNVGKIVARVNGVTD